MITDNFCRERQSEAAAMGFRGDKRIKQVIADVIGDTRPIVRDFYDQRQMAGRFLTRPGETDARSVRRGQANLATLQRRGFCGIFTRLRKIWIR